jgi:hypothetical protein
MNDEHDLALTTEQEQSLARINRYLYLDEVVPVAKQMLAGRVFRKARADQVYDTCYGLDGEELCTEMAKVGLDMIAEGKYVAGGFYLNESMYRHCEEQACLFLGYDVDLLTQWGSI